MNDLSKNEEYADVLKLLKDKMHTKMDDIGDTFEKNSFYKKNCVSKRKIKKSFSS